MSGGISPQVFMWFEASAALRHDAELLIQNVHTGVRAPQNNLLQTVLNAFVAECLHTYFIVPSERIDLSPMGRKIVITAVATLRKTIQMVIGRIIRKLTNRDMRSLAEFMDSVMLRDHASRQARTFIAFPLDPDTVEQFNVMQQRAATLQPSSTVDVIANFQSIADEAVSYFFADPIAELRLGPMLNKIALLGIDSSRSVITGLIRRIFSTMTPEQVALTVDYFCQHISSADQLGVATQGSPHWA